MAAPPVGGSAAAAASWGTALSVAAPAAVAELIFANGFEEGICASWSAAATVETCDGIDNDCDGVVDEGVAACFHVPFGAAPSPGQEDASYETALHRIDAYMLLDRSGSMAAEITAIKNNLATVASGATCFPAGSGSPSQCFESPWWGSGTIGYSGTSGEAYTHHADLQADASTVATAIESTEPSGGFDETVHLALWSTVTGGGSADAPGPCTLDNSYAARESCAASPAGSDGTGFPCFRPGALPVVFLFTDEAPSDWFACPTATAVKLAAIAAGARVVGLPGDVAASSELTDLARDTGAVDPDGTPMVFSAVNENATTALQTALATIAQGIPLHIGAEVVDDPGDAVDAVASFVERIEVLPLGTGECADPGATDDGDADGFDDTYLGAITGTPLCWRLVLRQNDAVAAGPAPQTYSATVRILGSGAVVLDERPVTFIVP